MLSLLGSRLVGPSHQRGAVFDYVGILGYVEGPWRIMWAFFCNDISAVRPLAVDKINATDCRNGRTPHRIFFVWGTCNHKS